MLIISILMTISGLLLIGLGLWGIHSCKGFLERLGALLAPMGLIITLLGVLLLCVPNFFIP